VTNIMGRYMEEQGSTVVEPSEPEFDDLLD